MNIRSQSQWSKCFKDCLRYHYKEKFLGKSEWVEKNCKETFFGKFQEERKKDDFKSENKENDWEKDDMKES